MVRLLQDTAAATTECLHTRQCASLPGPTADVETSTRIDARTFSLDTSVAVNEAPAAEAAVDTNTNACDDETRDQYIGPEQDRDLEGCVGGTR